MAWHTYKSCLGARLPYLYKIESRESESGGGGIEHSNPRDNTEKKKKKMVSGGAGFK